MAEEFNPNAFRQQMAEKAGKIPAPVSAPQHPPAQQQAQPQSYAPPAGQASQYQQPAPVPQQHAPQHHVPQQHIPQQNAPQQTVMPHQGQAQHVHQGMQQQGGQFQQPQQQPQQHFQPQLQQAYAQPPHPQAQHQGNSYGNHQMPEVSPQGPKVKRSLFKRKKLQSIAALPTSQMPQMPDLISGHMPEHMDKALNALPTTQGIARPIVFVAGLALGVLGMTIGNMLFSGGDKSSIKAISSVSELASEMPMDEDGIIGKTEMTALTDEMLLNK